MAALPSPTQVSGSSCNIYEAYYNFIDPNGFGSVGGMEAARFLKKSGLSDIVLSRIWDLSDPGGRGSLDKSGIYVALKLVALVQNGKDLSLKNIYEDVPAPKMSDVPLPKILNKPPPPPSHHVSTHNAHNAPLISSIPPSAVDWTVKPSEREKYDKLFDSLQPLNGLIPGNKVKNVLMDSKLPVDTLCKIWELADQDKDGMLNRHEFVVAMHLVYKALEKYAIPNTLPAELAPPVKRKNSTSSSSSSSILNRPIIIKDGINKPEIPPAPLNVQPIIPQKPVQTIQPTLNWVVSVEDKTRYDDLFIKSDVDKDGFVSGGEIKDVFLRSGVTQPVLAHIWALCDIKHTGKLNNEQFALAMWFVARCLKGIDPPVLLTPEMVPPSFRSSFSTTKSDGIVENNNTRYSNPELDMISKDTEALYKERLALEADIAQKEADIKIKIGEIKNLQSELDTLAATLKQLENQKGEAQKRLNDLKAQKVNVDFENSSINFANALANLKVDKLRDQASEQAELVAQQENELKSRKEILDGLRQEEQRLEKQKSENLNKLDAITTNLQETQLNISQVKAVTTQLEEQTRQLSDAIKLCDNGIQSGDYSQIPEQTLRISPDFRDSEYHKIGLTNGNSTTTNTNKKKIDPFQNNDNDAFAELHNDDDPFKNNEDPFNDPFSSSSKKESSFTTSSDPFTSSSFNHSQQQQQQQHDHFGKNFINENNKEPPPSSVEKDPFGCDPFAVLHAPTRDTPQRPSSPSPALPPKKSKQPPPRPAPPRPIHGPPVGAIMKKTSQQQEKDAFGSDPFDDEGAAREGGAGTFADFSNFESKLASSKSTTKTTTTTTTKNFDFSDDPFKDYRYEDPFNITFDEDEEEEVLEKKSTIKTTNLDPFNDDKFDPFGLQGRQSVPLVSSASFSLNGRNSAPLVPTEDQQLAWAAKESLKIAEQRKKLKEQEDAELAIALKLSLKKR